jgi:hypothetical protein
MDHVNGKAVNAKNEGAARIQSGARELDNTRENFGPKTMEKASRPGNPKAFDNEELEKAHQTHIHISSQ